MRNGDEENENELITQVSVDVQKGICYIYYESLIILVFFKHVLKIRNFVKHIIVERKRKYYRDYYARKVQKKRIANTSYVTTVDVDVEKGMRSLK